MVILYIHNNGSKDWFLDSQRHRLNGPSSDYCNGSKWYHQFGKLHRLDGPAVEFPKGTRYWYYQDQRIDCKTQEEFEKIIKLRVLW